MTATQVRLRRGAYFDSIVLMQLQIHLDIQPGVLRSAAVMATQANLDMLAAAGMALNVEPAPEDLLLAVEAEDSIQAESAIDSFDTWIQTRRRPTTGSRNPRTLAAAALQKPNANWVAISVPGEYAADLTRQALELDKHVFLFSDNVSLEAEQELKQLAASRQRLLLGPDCGTAILGGVEDCRVGLGFSNLTAEGAIGIVGASGTGIQYAVSRLAERGHGISHALGVGGRDLHSAVGGLATRQCMDVLRTHSSTKVRMLISKPADSKVLGPLLRRWQAEPQPTIVCIQGQAPPQRRLGSLTFAVDLEDAVGLAVEAVAAATSKGATTRTAPSGSPQPAAILGLFSGGTIAGEIERSLGAFGMSQPAVRIEDLGDDESTRGRGHPMIDPRKRIDRLKAAGAEDVKTVVLDIVLGTGAAQNPALDLSMAIREVTGAGIAVMALLVGTDSDLQDRSEQRDILRSAGATIVDRIDLLVEDLVDRHSPAPAPLLHSAQPATITVGGVINVGLESFYDSLCRQGVDALPLDWKPPAGGRTDLAALLDRLRD